MTTSFVQGLRKRKPRSQLVAVSGRRSGLPRMVPLVPKSSVRFGMRALRPPFARSVVPDPRSARRPSRGEIEVLGLRAGRAGIFRRGSPGNASR